MKKIFTASAILLAVFASTVSVAIAITAESDFYNSLSIMRQEKQAFGMAKELESSERKLALTERTRAKRNEAEGRRAEAERNMENKRKVVLLSLVDIQVKYLEKTKERIKNMPNISNDLKAQLYVEIENSKNEINSKKNEIQNADSRDAIKKLAKEVKDIFKKKREIVKSIVDAIHASRVSSAVNTAEKRSENLKAKIKKLQDEYKDTTELEYDAQDADNNISSAKKYIEAENLDDATESLKNAYVKFEDIEDKLK